MQKYTERQTVKVSVIQKETLNKIGSLGYNTSKFIRDAIAEKIEREFKQLKLKTKYPYALKVLGGNYKTIL